MTAPPRCSCTACGPRKSSIRCRASELNRVLIEAADEMPNVAFRFGQLCLGLAHEKNVLEMRDEATGHIYHTDAQPSIATDGAGSAVRDALVAREVATVREEPLDHDYKELTIPAVDGKPALEVNALHIWPRGGFMLIALPNPGCDVHGHAVPGAAVARTASRSSRSPGAVEEFFAREFPSARALMPDLTREFFENPQGSLGTVYTRGWHLNGDVLLLGDAAHAIVPFHGQGMNCAFEDCAELDAADGRASQLGRVVRGVRARAAGRTPMPSRRWRWRTTWRCARRCWIRSTAGRRRKRKSWRRRIRTSFRGIRW